MNSLNRVRNAPVVLLVLSSMASPAATPQSQTSNTNPAPPASASTKGSAFTGAWSLNKELSDRSQIGGGGRDDRGDGGDRRGGFGGGRRGGIGGGPGGAGGIDPQQAERQREAMRDVMNPPDHLTVVSTESMVILTGPDGRAIRLSPDGKKIKDENTNIERKTKWDGDKLVSEVTGLAGAKITETYSLDIEHAQLHVTAAIEGGRGGAARTITHVYDRDSR